MAGQHVWRLWRDFSSGLQHMMLAGIGLRPPDWNHSSLTTGTMHTPSDSLQDRQGFVAVWCMSALEADVGAAGGGPRAAQRLKGAVQQQVRDCVRRVRCIAYDETSNCASQKPSSRLGDVQHASNRHLSNGTAQDAVCNVTAWQSGEKSAGAFDHLNGAAHDRHPPRARHRGPAQAAALKMTQVCSAPRKLAYSSSPRPGSCASAGGRGRWKAQCLRFGRTDLLTFRFRNAKLPDLYAVRHSQHHLVGMRISARHSGIDGGRKDANTDIVKPLTDVSVHAWQIIDMIPEYRENSMKLKFQLLCPFHQCLRNPADHLLPHLRVVVHS